VKTLHKSVAATSCLRAPFIFLTSRRRGKQQSVVCVRAYAISVRLPSPRALAGYIYINSEIATGCSYCSCLTLSVVRFIFGWIFIVKTTMHVIYVECRWRFRDPVLRPFDSVPSAKCQHVTDRHFWYSAVIAGQWLPITQTHRRHLSSARFFAVSFRIPRICCETTHGQISRPLLIQGSA